MTLETSTPIDAAEDGFTPNDPAVGSAVQIRHDLANDDGDAIHKHAGLYGTISGRDPFGGYLVKIGGKAFQFNRHNFTVVAAPGATPDGSAVHHSTRMNTTDDADHPPVRLVNEPPLAAINSPTNPRRRRGLDIDSLRALADSITEYGLGNPILVRPLPASRVDETSDMDPRPAYEVIAGERRWRAAQLAELDAMPMVVRHMDDHAVLEMQLVENIEREDLDPMEEAEGFALLRDKLGYTVDQIAARMGKGRGESYVRKRMKLLDLTPDSREAMYEGTLMLSTGLLVAKYPADTQARAVKIIKGMEGRGADGKPVPAPFRTVALELFRKLNTLLKTAAFDTQAPELVPATGPCSACPKRTRADQDLFTEATDAGDDSCLDSACWESKKTAHVQRIRADAQARGLPVMDEADAAKAVPSPYGNHIQGYTRLSDTAYTETGNDGEERAVTYADALRAQGRKAPKPIVLINPHTSKAEEVIPDDLADKLMPEVEKEKAPVGARPPVVEDQRTPEERAMRQSDVRRAVIIRAFDAIRTGQRTEDELRRVAFIVTAGADATFEYLGWQDLSDADDFDGALRERLNGQDADQLGRIIAMAALECELSMGSTSVEEEVQLVQGYGVDIQAVAAKVAEDLERQQAQAPADREGDGEAGDEGDEE